MPKKAKERDSMHSNVDKLCLSFNKLLYNMERLRNIESAARAYLEPILGTENAVDEIRAERLEELRKALEVEKVE